MAKIDKNMQAQQAASVQKTPQTTKAKATEAAKKTTKSKSVQNQQAINNIAKGLYDAARKYSGAVGKEEFTNLLKKINKDNVVGVINRYNNELSTDESIVEMILDEYFSDTKDMQEALVGEGAGKNAIKGIFTCLMERAKEVGVDPKTLDSYKTQFNTILESELKGAAIARSSKKLDEIITVVIQSINNQVQAKATKTQVSVEQASWLELGAVNILMDKNSAAVNAFNKYLKNEKASERMAEGFSKIWGSNNTKVKVREDIEANNKQLAELKEAAKQGDEAFRAKFQEIFGIAFNPTNIRAYQDAQKMYQNAAKAKSDEDNFKSAFSLLLKSDKLQEEGVNQSASTTGASYYRTTATKEQVFQREFNKMAKMFDSVVKSDAENFKKQGIESGGDFLNKKFELANATTDDAKYAVLSSLAKQIASGLEASTTKACGGRTFDAVKKQYDNSYKAAYGLNNDIQKRVNDYVDSQIKGGGYVKMIGTMAVVMSVSALTAGAGAAAAGTSMAAATAKSAAVGAATFAGTKFAIDVADNFSTPELREVLRNEGVRAFLEKGSEQTDWKGITVGALQGGAMCLMFAGQSYAITNLVARAGQALGASAAATGYATAGANALGITALGLGTEYVLTGEISVEGAIFTVVMAVTTAGIQVMQINKAVAQAKAETEAALNEKIYNARHTLGFEDDVEVTADGLKSQFRKLSIKYHPDKGGSEVQMAIINDAYNTLQTNMPKINNVVVPQSSVAQAAPAQEPVVQPEAPVANPSGETAVAVQSDAIVVPMSQPSQGYAGAIAAIGAGPAASVEGVVTGGAAPVVDAQQIMSNAQAKIASTEVSDAGGITGFELSKDANGNTVKTVVKEGYIERNTFVNGDSYVEQTIIDGKEVGKYVSDGKNGTYLDAAGNVVTEETFQASLTKALEEAYNSNVQAQSAPKTVTNVTGTVTSDAAQTTHSKIVNGEFEALGTKSPEQVGAEYKAYAEENGLKFIDHGSEFEIQDANGNVVREAHEGFFDGRWYDHHQVFNENNKITNRFVVDNNGKLQSTVEYFYDEAGNQTMSVGYGGKSGTDVMVFEGPNRFRLTIQEFVDKYGFEPKYYREINPEVKFEATQPSSAEPAAKTEVSKYTSWSTERLIDEYNAQTYYGGHDLPEIEAAMTQRGIQFTHGEELDIPEVPAVETSPVSSNPTSKQNIYRPGVNAYKDQILEQAGFSPEVISHIIENGPYGKFQIDSQLVNEVLNMVVYLEGEVANGATINKSLIQFALDRFSLGASGTSSSSQLAILANYWSKGDAVYNAFGQKAPSQSTFSQGNLKAKWNRFKSSVKEFYEDTKFDLGIEDKPSKQAVADAQKAKAYSTWDTEKLMDEFNARYNYGVKEDISLIRAELTERGYAPNQNGYFVDPAPANGSSAAAQAATLEQGYKYSLLEALTETKIGDPATVQRMINEQPEFINRLSLVKASDGSQLFDAKNVDLVLVGLTEVIESQPEKIWAALSNPEEIAKIEKYSNPSAGLWNAVNDPLPSTVKANPELFGVKVVTTDGTQASSQAAATEAANFLRSAEAPSSRAAAKFNTVAKTSPEAVGKETELTEWVKANQNPSGPSGGKPYVKPEMTEVSVAPQGEVMASDGYTSTGLWSRFKRAVGIGGKKTLDSVLESARTEGALVEELENGEYRVTQRLKSENGKSVPVGHNAESFRVETVTVYKAGSVEPVEHTKYYNGHSVAQRTVRDGENLTHIIYDRGTKYGVSYSGYDAKGNKVPGQEQSVSIIYGDEQKVLATYTGEDLENAMLAPIHNTTDRYASSLLDVDSALSGFSVNQRILEWQASDGTKYLVESGKRYKPENLTRPVAQENVKEYTDFASETPAYAEKMGEYNEYAKARNLTIEENGNTLQFKNEKGQVVREIYTSDKRKILKDDFYQLTRNGEITQSVTTDGNGKILSRTLTEYRQWWGKACTVTLDYVKGKAHTGLYLDGELTQPQELTLEQGYSRFRDIAGYIR